MTPNRECAYCAASGLDCHSCPPSKIDDDLACMGVRCQYWPGRRTDFLLVRDGAGRLSVRELSGTIVVGQQEPKVKVPYPRTKEKR